MIEPGKRFACIIWGGYAQGNTGDELCLAAALERKQREFDGNVAVLSHRPEFTAQLFPNVSVIPYVPAAPKSSWLSKRYFRACKYLAKTTGLAFLMRDMRIDRGSEWACCLSRSGQLYLAGGGYLTDLFPLDFFMPPIQFAIKLKLPVATAPVGIGPFKSNLYADKLTTVLRRMKLTVRDQASVDFCHVRGIDTSLEPDDAFALVKNLLPPVLLNQQDVRPRKIGVCIFTQHGQDVNCDLTGLVDEVFARAQGTAPRI